MATEIGLEFSDKGEEIKPFWKKLVTAGRAAEGLRDDWRRQLREMQREIGFEYIRFHGIFHDDMMIYHEDDHGNPYYNWQYLNSLFDFLLEVGIRPFVELGFTPSALKTGEATVFWWKANITPPKDYDKWTDLVKSFVVHCINRYGLNEVLHWYFEVWNEPNLYKIFWDGTQEEYYRLYRCTVEAVKSIHSGLRVGGPSTSSFGNDGKGHWIEDMLAYCARNNVVLDFITTHPYPNSWPFDEKTKQVIMGYRDAESTSNDLKWLRDKVEESSFNNLEIHLTEWNSSPSSRDLVHDTAFMAPFIIQNNLKCLDLADSLGFWTFTDVFEEQGAGDSFFHGGFGMINTSGLKKPSYYGYWFLSKLGNEKLAQGDDFVVTRNSDQLQILMWNYCHYKKEFSDGNRASLNAHDRYSIFEETGNRTFGVEVHGLDGKYKVVEYLLDQEHGSVYDIWLKNGCLENPTLEELAVLEKQTGPQGAISFVRDRPQYQKKIVIPPHGVHFIELQKIKG